MRGSTRRVLAVVVGLLIAAAGSHAAADVAADEPDDDPTRAIEGKLAVLELEALGMDPEPVARLEALFRKELERLAGAELPTRRQIDKVVSSSRKLSRCGGADSCLAEIGKKLGVDLVVTGNVAALGDSFILNIKAVDVASGKKLPRRIATKPLRGSPDELIEAVRVAAYQLLAPAEIHGAINVLTDLVGAEVKIDGKVYGKTPLIAPISKLPLGDHRLEVTAEGYVPFDETVRVRFQKTSRVMVRLVVVDAANQKPLAPVVKKRPAPKRWYNSTWFIVGAGVTAAIVGGVVGYKLAVDPVIDCGAEPDKCGL